ncbi:MULTISPECIES: hypothetical protein [unclassified Cryobacterium]|uniref:hypothetical protein n=1 Tax=unclassified Cryobacterium TaxID=2649013 RepID=UPI002AB57E18|nr:MULTISPECIES: hypothetical protein [unclassified Cryobacterium]MDY7542621.1 hypothetical protein [Cryobacterium sp. 5B3]MEB0264741.1 hypothetical protein [Cryobacterium sp. 10I5]MEB0273713.1 hypothetical protein [Cryobacterium sp. 5B3]
MSNEEHAAPMPYTPTTEQIRDLYRLGALSVDAIQPLDLPETMAMFDRWLADALESLPTPPTGEPEREALALLLYRADWGHPRMDLGWPTTGDLAKGRSIFDPPPTVAEFQSEFFEKADAILVAGYRRQPEPREVTTVEELNALPVESVVMSEDIAYQKDGVSIWDGAGRCWSTTQIDLPARILFTPSTEQP